MGYNFSLKRLCSETLDWIVVEQGVGDILPREPNHDGPWVHEEKFPEVGDVFRGNPDILESVDFDTIEVGGVGVSWGVVFSIVEGHGGEVGVTRSGPSIWDLSISLPKVAISRSISPVLKITAEAIRRSIEVFNCLHGFVAPILALILIVRGVVWVGWVNKDLRVIAISGRRPLSPSGGCGGNRG